jgi:two-component system sensor histidine kinase/response regulator
MTPASSNGAETPGAGRALRVLVAEDNEVSRAIAVRLLTRRGHHAVVVGTGREAVDACAEGGFDLILMDLQMPQMDGFAATAAIRDSEKGTARYIPIIALTANAASTDEARCRAAGMDAFISKPVRVDAFFEVIASVLHSGAAACAQLVAVASADSEVFDLAAALEAVDGERELLAGMIAIFMQQTPRIMQDIDDAIGAANAAALELAAHKLKGSVAMFGARAARVAAQCVEDLASAGNLTIVAPARQVLGAEIERLTAALRGVAVGDAS